MEAGILELCFGGEGVSWEVFISVELDLEVCEDSPVVLMVSVADWLEDAGTARMLSDGPFRTLSKWAVALFFLGPNAKWAEISPMSN